MRVFLNDLHTSLAQTLVTKLSAAGHEVFGAVPSKTQVLAAKRHLQNQENQEASMTPTEPVVVYSNKDAVDKLLQSADIIIFSLLDSPHEALSALEVLDSVEPNEDEDAKFQVFIAISTVLTWAKSAGEGLKEDDYKTRKPARKYADYKSTETQIIGFSRPDRLSTYVIAAGLLFGGKESQLDFLLQEAWLGEREALPVPAFRGAPGDNVLPMIHIEDLATIASSIADASVSSSPPSKSYILAVCHGQDTLREITQAVSDTLGTGKIENLSSSEADDLMLEYASLTALQLNIKFNLEAGTNLVQDMGLELQYDDGVVKNIDAVVKNYIEAMDLRPLRIVILGPPQVGKTYYAQQLAKTYALQHLSLETCVKKILDDVLPADDYLLHMTEEQYANLRLDLEPHAEKAALLPENHSTRALQVLLKTLSSNNQGYVLDGLPLTLAQAKVLFNQPKQEEDAEAPADADNEGDEEGAKDTDRRRLLKRQKRLGSIPLPTHLIILDGEDEVLKSRALQMSEEDAQRTGNTEGLFKDRMNLYRNQAPSKDTTPFASFFEETIGIDVLEQRVEVGDENDAVAASIKRYIESGGKPFNFHPTKAEREAEKKLEEQRRMKQASEEEEADAKLRSEEEQSSASRSERDQIRMSHIAEEEAALLEARALPLRQYLMQTVIPTLTEGMLEVVHLQPEDPIDFLADFLFQKGNEYEQQLLEKEMQGEA